MIDEKLRTSLKECPNTRAGVKKKKKRIKKEEDNSIYCACYMNLIQCEIVYELQKQ